MLARGAKHFVISWLENYCIFLFAHEHISYKHMYITCVLGPKCSEPFGGVHLLFNCCSHNGHVHYL